MFCVLSVKRRENTLYERLFGKYIKDDYTLKAVPVFKGAPFYVLTATVGKMGADFDMVAEIAGKCSGKLLTDAVLPEVSGLGTFKSDLLYRKVTENTFLKILANNPFKNVCVIGKNANTDFLKKASRSSLRLTLVTDSKERYEKTCDEILEDTGISVSLLSSPDNSEIIVDLEGLKMTVGTKNGIVIIENGSGYAAPEAYKKIKPDNVSDRDFYSALYELCGVFSLGDGVFRDIEANSQKRCADSIHFT